MESAGVGGGGISVNWNGPGGEAGSRGENRDLTESHEEDLPAQEVPFRKAWDSNPGETLTELQRACSESSKNQTLPSLCFSGHLPRWLDSERDSPLGNYASNYRSQLTGDETEATVWAARSGCPVTVVTRIQWRHQVTKIDTVRC